MCFHDLKLFWELLNSGNFYSWRHCVSWIFDSRWQTTQSLKYGCGIRTLEVDSSWNCQWDFGILESAIFWGPKTNAWRTIAWTPYSSIRIGMHSSTNKAIILISMVTTWNCSIVVLVWYIMFCFHNNKHVGSVNTYSLLFGCLSYMWD